MSYNIGKAAELSSLSAKMIRYYEGVGLLAPVSRSESGYRTYDEHDIHTLRFIKRSRDLGFSVKQIEELLALWNDKERASAEVKQVAAGHLSQLKKKRAELNQMIATLEHLVAHCHGDQRPDCPILGELGG